MKFERHLKGAMNLNYGFGGIVMYFPKMKPWLAASLATAGTVDSNSIQKRAEE